MRVFLSSTVAGLFMLSSVALAQRPGAFVVGRPFPNLVLPALDGKPMSLADFRGKKVILHIFASW